MHTRTVTLIVVAMAIAIACSVVAATLVPVTSAVAGDTARRAKAPSAADLAPAASPGGPLSPVRAGDAACVSATALPASLPTRRGVATPRVTAATPVALLDTPLRI